MPTTLVWFHHDLRLADHPALHAAAARGRIVPVFVWAPAEAGDWPPGAAHRWWLHHSLAALDARLQSHDLRLVLREGPSPDALRALATATDADAVFWNTRFEPALARRDEALADALRRDGLAVKTFASRILHDPAAIQTTTGGPYQVFTPFWKKLKTTLTVGPALPVPAFSADHRPAAWPESTSLDALGLRPPIDWAAGLRDHWTPGEAAAHATLDRFLDRRLDGYAQARDRPDRDGTSELSPHLHHGEISIRQVWNAVLAHAGRHDDDTETFLKELAWREFAYHLLAHFPDTPTTPLRAKYAAFPWQPGPEALGRWQKGRTGYPIVDAGMRQLWHIGWMHNRVRMIVASFLTKDLLIDWQAGAAWFWDTLVGGDLANNTLGWQWAAGSGADAQPFFRIFNPVAQGKRFDPEGDYVRRWVPELAALPNRHLHAPWEAPAEVLEQAGVTLGETYPEPLVDHGQARKRALAAYAKIK